MAQGDFYSGVNLQVPVGKRYMLVDMIWYNLQEDEMVDDAIVPTTWVSANNTNRNHQGNRRMTRHMDKQFKKRIYNAGDTITGGLATVIEL